MYNTLADALKDILKTQVDELKFFGNKALFSMDGMNVAEISLVTGSTSGQYPKLVTKIQNKDSGIIATNDFIFEDYLTRKSCDNPNVNSVLKMHIWAEGASEVDWYIARPESTKPITDAIFEYIGMYS